MRYTVRIQRQAIDDIIRNALWWAEHHSMEEAIRWEAAIFAKIESLVNFPESHSVAFENDDFSYELREAHFGLGSRPGYRILFTIVEQTIHVLTVKAAQENWVREEELPDVPLSDQE